MTIQQSSGTGAKPPFPGPQHPSLRALDRGADLLFAGFVAFGAVAMTVMSVLVMMVIIIARSGTGRHR